MANNGPWNYIIVFSDKVGKREDVRAFIDSRAEFINWYSCLSNAFFVRSQYTANQITDLFREFSGDKGRFIVLDVDTDRNGWLPPKAWEFMKNKS